MTPEQQQTLDLIKRINDGEFSSWFQPSEVMAFCQIESRFKAHAYRYEPRLGEGSYGAMQVLASTAKQVCNITNPEDLYGLEVGLRTGMSVAKTYYEQLQKRLGRDPDEEEWSDSYNRGVGGVLREEDLGEDTADDTYTKDWVKAWQYWQDHGADN